MLNIRNVRNIRTANRTVLFFIFCCLLSDCREPFELDTGYGSSGFLVVDGYINIGEGITTIKLTRTTAIEDEPTQTNEQGALVVIEDDQFTYPLTETSAGSYTSEELELPLDREYRLRITTTDGNVYLSDYTKPIQAPPIDSVTWKQDQEGLNIFVTTHNPSNSTNYYRWAYDEIWEQQSVEYSFVKYEDGAFVNRDNDDIKNAYTCWKYNSSNEINIASTTALASNVIASQVITSVSQIDERMAVRYSILVKQTGLSQEAFQFFDILLKNNESLGTFFDPQPSQLPTNLRCITGNKIVVGFINSSTTETYRLFIDRSELIRWGFQLQCLPLRLGFDSAGRYMKWYTPTTFMTEPGQPILTGVEAVLHPCADCRLRGGTNLKPLYWEIEEE